MKPPRWTSTVCRVLVVAALVGLSGCPFGGNERERSNNMKIIGVGWQNYCDANNKGPAKAADLGPYVENDKRILDALESGRIVLVYNVGLRDLIASGPGTSMTVIAYEADVPTKGGWVALADASVRKVTPDEFKGLTIPKPKDK